MVVNNRAVAALASLQFFFLLASVIVLGQRGLVSVVRSIVRSIVLFKGIKSFM